MALLLHSKSQQQNTCMMLAHHACRISSPPAPLCRTRQGICTSRRGSCSTVALQVPTKQHLHDGIPPWISNFQIFKFSNLSPLLHYAEVGKAPCTSRSGSCPKPSLKHTEQKSSTRQIVQIVRTACHSKYTSARWSGGLSAAFLNVAQPGAAVLVVTRQRLRDAPLLHCLRKGNVAGLVVPLARDKPAAQPPHPHAGAVHLCTTSACHVSLPCQHGTPARSHYCFCHAHYVAQGPQHGICAPPNACLSS